MCVFINSIPKEKIARAASRAGLYARAVKYQEIYLFEILQSQGLLVPRISEPEAVGTALNYTEIEFLQRLYLSLDDRDAVEGVSLLRMSQLSLREQIREYNASMNWSESLNAYSQGLLSEPLCEDLHVGLINASQQLNQWDTAICHAKVNMLIPTISSAVQRAAIPSCWRAGQWDTLNTFVSNLSATEISEFDVVIGKLLSFCAGSRGTDNAENPLIDLVAARYSIVHKLSSAAMESYTRAYPYILQLHMLTDLENFILEKKGNSFDVSKENSWESSSRLNRTQASYFCREPLLSLHRIMTEIKYSNTHEKVGLAWLKLAKEARTSNQLTSSAAALLHASRFLKSENFIGMYRIQRAKLMFSIGDRHKALSIMEEDVKEFQKKDKESREVPFLNRINTPPEIKRANSIRQGKSFLLLARWHELAGIKTTNEVKTLFENAIQSFSQNQETEKSHFLLAKYTDHLHRIAMREILSQNDVTPENKSAIRSETANFNWTSTKNSITLFQGLSSKSSSGNFLVFLDETIRHYAYSLALGHRYIYESLPRLLTLWYEYHDQLYASTKVRDSKQPNSVMENCSGFMLEFVKTQPAYQWLTVLPQLLSRIAHPSSHIENFNVHIMNNVYTSFPHQLIWSLCPLLSFQRACKAAKNAVEKIISRQSGVWHKSFFRSSMDFIDGVKAMCLNAPPAQLLTIGKSKVFSLNKTFSGVINSLNSLTKLGQAPIVPILSSFNPNLPSSGITNKAYVCLNGIYICD